MARKESSGDDRDGADTAAMELMVLDRLLYRNRSQHRSAKYYTHVLEVRRACGAFAAPKLPDLLAEGLGLIARVPDSRNGRAREAWVRSAAGGLRRMRVAAVACAHSLETIVKASKLLAHQVSQTYFMALSTVFLASLARLFACNLHLGGRLLLVHGALLRTFLAQPCLSDTVSTAELAECRVPEDTVSFLSRLSEAGGAHKTSRMKNESNAAGSFSGNRGTENTGRQPSSSSSAPVATSGESPPGEQGSGGGDADGSDDDSDDTGVHIGRVASVEAEEVNRADAASKEALNGAESRRLAAGVGEGRTSVREGRAAAVTTGLAGGMSAAGRLGGGGVGGDDGGGSGHASGHRDNVSGVHGAKMPRKKVVLASEFSDSSSDEDRETECSKSGPKTPQPSTSARALVETGHSTSPSPEVPRQKLPVHHQPSLFFSSTPRRARQPGPKPLSGEADDSSNAAATGPTESAAPAVPSDRGDVGLSGDASDVRASSAARQAPPAAGAGAVARAGQSEPPVGWVIDVRPTPPSDIPLLSRRKKKRRKKAGGGLAAAGLAASTGHKDTVSSAATDGDISVRDEDPHPASSALLEPGMPTGRGGGGGDGGRSAQATSIGEEEPVEAQGAGVSDAATPGRRQASCSNTGRGSGSGEDDEECKIGATNAPGLSKDTTGRPKKATSTPRSGVTNSRKPGTAVLPGTAADAGADAGVAASAATAEAGRGTLGRSVNTGRVPQKGTVHAADGPESESRGDLRMTLKMTQLASAGNSKRSASETERQPKETDKTIGSGGGGQAGTKRSSSGEGREEESKRVKKPKKKKKKKTGAGGSFSLSAVKRDDIDDIFGSLT
ncbi:unnamed protein product [Ectocarpus sp. 6 AP-2014]